MKSGAKSWAIDGQCRRAVSKGCVHAPHATYATYATLSSTKLMMKICETFQLHCRATLP